MKSGKKGGPRNSSARRIVRAMLAVVLLSALSSLFPSLACAAVTARSLTDASDYGGRTSYSTVSISPKRFSLVLAWVVSGKDSTLISPTLAGNNLTWVNIGATDFDTGTDAKHRITLFRALGTTINPTAGAVTIEFASRQTNCAWSIVEFSGVDISGSNGEGAISTSVVIQTLDNSSPSSGLSIPVVAGSGNVTVGGFANSDDSTNAVIAGSGFTRSPGTYTGSPRAYLMSEWSLAGSTPIYVTQANTANIAGIALGVKAGPIPVLGSGIDPPSVTVAPVAAETIADTFTLHVTEGATVVSSMTVTLADGTWAGLSKVTITDEAGTVYGSVDNPGINILPITLSAPIMINTDVKTYQIRITPKSHAVLPAPPGSSYGVTAKITDIGGHTGSDSSNTTTVDNQSPANVTSLIAALGDRETPLSWSNPPDADLGSIVVLRKQGSAVADTPVEGATYSVGNTIGTSTVVCVVANPGSSCTDTGLTNNTTYYYRVYARDINGNYSTTTGVAVASATPNRFTPDLMIKTSDLSDSYLTDNIYETSAATQAKTQGVLTGVAAVYKVRLENDGTATDNLTVKAAAAGSNFTVQFLDETLADRTAEITGSAGLLIPAMLVGHYREWTVKITPNGAGTPVPGGSSYELRVTATSGSDGTKRDQVKAVTTSTSANVTLLQSTDKTSCRPGEEITYSITASNGASLTAASGVQVTYPIPASTGLKVGSPAFSPGSSTLTSAVKYFYDGSWEYLPQSGRCSAPAGYDYCVTQVRWLTSGNMPTSTNFTCTMVVRVK